MIVTLSVNLIPINWAQNSSSQELTGFNGRYFLEISWRRIWGYFNGIHPLISCYFHGTA